jgi:antitoxin component of RelBE/YafQ-DinJ toxin-antitoxin module
MGLLGMTSTQAVNMFFAQIECRKAIPLPITVEDNSDIAPPIEQVAKVWGDLDQTDFSYLDKH